MAKNYSPEIAKAVEEFFTKEELNYIPCNENGVIPLRMTPFSLQGI